MKRVLSIWTEGGRGIGMGHLHRCLAIARELRNRGWSVIFFVNDDPSAEELIEQAGFQCELSSQNGVETICRIFGEGTCLMVDTKREVSDMVGGARGCGVKTILMDNEGSARFMADIVIYPSLFRRKDVERTRYVGRVVEGPEYISIGRSFLEARLKGETLACCPPWRILVTMGGSDPNLLTYEVTHPLLRIKKDLRVKIVMGSAFSYDHRLQELEMRGLPNVEFVRNVSDLSMLMSSSHVAITAVGVTLYELACVGVPSVIVANYREDGRDMDAFRELEFALPLGYYKEVSGDVILEAVEDILSDTRRWENMSERGRTLIDGRGAERIATVIEEASLR